MGRRPGSGNGFTVGARDIKLMTYIRSCSERNYHPSIPEMMREAGYCSYTGFFSRIKVLISHGLVQREQVGNARRRPIYKVIADLDRINAEYRETHSLLKERKRKGPKNTSQSGYDCEEVVIHGFRQEHEWREMPWGKYCVVCHKKQWRRRHIPDIADAHAQFKRNTRIGTKIQKLKEGLQWMKQGDQAGITPPR